MNRMELQLRQNCASLRKLKNSMSRTVDMLQQASATDAQVTNGNATVASSTAATSSHAGLSECPPSSFAQFDFSGMR